MTKFINTFCNKQSKVKTSLTHIMIDDEWFETPIFLNTIKELHYLGESENTHIFYEYTEDGVQLYKGVKGSEFNIKIDENEMV